MSISCSLPAPVRSPLSSATKKATKSTKAHRVGRALSFKTKKVKAKKQRKSRVLFHYTKEELEPYFDISQKEAAKHLGIAVITLKRICKRGKFNWPYRANKTKESRERNQRKAMSSAPKKTRAMKTCRIKTEPVSEYSPYTFDGITTGDDVCHALRSLAMCAFKLEEQESQGAYATTAAEAFSRLPLLCMRENTTTVEL